MAKTISNGAAIGSATSANHNTGPTTDPQYIFVATGRQKPEGGH